MTFFLSPSYCSLLTVSSPQGKIQCFPVNFQYALASVLSSSSCLRRPYRIPITTKLAIIFPLIMCFGRHFLRKKWPMKSAFLPSFFYFMYVIPLFFVPASHFFISHTIVPTDLLCPPAHFKTSQIFLLYFTNCTNFSNIYKAIFKVSVNRCIYLRFEV